MSDQTAIRHVLLFRFHPEAAPASIQLFIDTFRQLKDKIEGILSFESGENNSVEGLNKNFTQVCVLTFANLKARDAYLPHPEHRKFVEWMSGLSIVADLLVIDYLPE